jgi:hypothetical protein
MPHFRRNETSTPIQRRNDESAEKKDSARKKDLFEEFEKKLRYLFV